MQVTKLALALIFLFATTANAARLHHEAVYQEHWCNEAGGVTEFRLPDLARVDCLLDQYAVEFDFSDKWAESIGQALLYANETGRHPGVVLISENGEDDYKFLLRFLSAISQSDRAWRLWIIEPGNLPPTKPTPAIPLIHLPESPHPSTELIQDVEPTPDDLLKNIPLPNREKT